MNYNHTNYELFWCGCPEHFCFFLPRQSVNYKMPEIYKTQEAYKTQEIYKTQEAYKTQGCYVCTWKDAMYLPDKKKTFPKRFGFFFVWNKSVSIKRKKPRVSVDTRGFKSGGYLLSHNKCTTIGAAELNDPVRNGKGWDLSTITTLT